MELKQIKEMVYQRVIDLVGEGGDVLIFSDILQGMGIEEVEGLYDDLVDEGSIRAMLLRFRLSFSRLMNLFDELVIEKGIEVNWPREMVVINLEGLVSIGEEKVEEFRKLKDYYFGLLDRVTEKMVEGSGKKEEDDEERYLGLYNLYHLLEQVGRRVF
jgi:hypothetical protein